MTAAKERNERLLRRFRLDENFSSEDDPDKAENIKIASFLHHFRDEKNQFSHEAVPDRQPKISVRNLSFFYGSKQVLFDNTLDIMPGKISSFIGPAGCGKSTHIRVYNRIFERYREQQASGEVIIDGIDILAPFIDRISLRRRVGMIFPQPTLFPVSIFDNMAYGLRLHYKVPKMELEDRVETALRHAALLDEVRDILHKPGTALSPGQQQRLCIARALAMETEVLLMDEPTSIVDPVTARKVEELIASLKDCLTIVLVTHNMQQAARISDFTAFFYKGYIVEFGQTKQLFTNPAKKQTEDYITGRFG